MTSINSSTKVKIVKKAPAISESKSVSTTNGSKSMTTQQAPTTGTAKQAPRGTAPKLEPKLLASSTQVLEEKSVSEQKDFVLELVREAFGEASSFKQRTVPHISPSSVQAQATRDRAHAAADVAVCAHVLGVQTVMKRFGVLQQLEQMLLPNYNNSFHYMLPNSSSSSNLKRIISTNSLFSSASDVGDGTSCGDDNYSQATGLSFDKGKVTPVLGREGALLMIRALCEIVGRPVEPFVIPLLGAALDESASSNGSLREASIDTSRALIDLANPHACSGILLPFLFNALKSKEWRTKWNALERLSQLADSAPSEISTKLPHIVPKVCEQVWDTKPQVSKAAGATLLALCLTNKNSDVRPAIPAIVQAMVKPSDTFKAIEELMGTTFVHAVDASTLSLLCPILSRGLKEKQALHKRACCVIITNMARLVETPQAVAPFGPLLVPELKKVVETVQFDDIREGALAALSTLAKALGHANVEDAVTFYKDQAAAAEEELAMIAQEREEALQKQLLIEKKEEEERQLWKEAQEATRLLDKIKIQEEEEKKAEEIKLKDAAKRSTKGEGGKCKSCGLKKCKKGCLFAEM